MSNTKKAQDHFIRENAAALYKHALILSAGDEVLADDLLQDTCELALKNWKKVATASYPVAYCKVMMKNRAIDLVRSSIRKGRSPSYDSDDSISVDGSDIIGSRDELLAALRQIHPNQRLAIVLRFYEDLDFSAIAEQLDISNGGARSLVSRGLGTMRELLSQTRALDGINAERRGTDGDNS